MKKNPSTSQPGFFGSCRLVAVLLCTGVACLPVAGPSLTATGKVAFSGHELRTKTLQRMLSFAERVSYQREIEDVYWHHRIWPKENPYAKPSVDTVISQRQLEEKVADYLDKSQALYDKRHQPITATELQAEMNRMAEHTKQPQVLRELFAALGNDPFVIAECLARSVLVERLLTPLASEQIEQASRTYQQVVPTTGKYRLPSISDEDACNDDDSWTATTTSNAPTGRSFQTSVWTGTEMIVWGGYEVPDFTNGLNTGGRYNPSTDSWAATTTANAPTARYLHTAVWTGNEMIVWGGNGGNTGSRYNPATNRWAATSTTNAPIGRWSHTADWTGSEMIVWGGIDLVGGPLNSGGKYDPNTNSWTGTTSTNAPSPREGHTAVWTGSEMIVWGGLDENLLPFNTGGKYNPRTNSWTATSTTNAPAARAFHTVVWSGSEMIVWGAGFVDHAGNHYFNSGGRYNPDTNSWTSTSTAHAPSPRYGHRAVWTGSEMIVWGGLDENLLPFNTGGKYNPSTNSWTATGITNVPAARAFQTAVWTGNQMIVWGGNDNTHSDFNTGGRYCAPFTGSQLGNISTRAFVQTGDNVVIGGFIVQGAQTKRVIIRAIGPELGEPPYNIPNALGNPTLELHDRTGALIASNDNWPTTIIGGIVASSQVRDITNSGYAPGDGRESAIIADLAPGNYTAIVRGVNNTTGVGLAEVYDLSGDASSILGDISTRSFVQTDDNVMIGGFIVQGTQPKRVIIRAIGPDLSQYGVSDPLADPTLELHNGMGAVIASNDDWQHTIVGGIIINDQVAPIRASGHAPGDPRESAIIANLLPGNYTAIVRGANNTTGVGLVEVYDLD